jgi:hypothetical protein
MPCVGRSTHRSEWYLILGQYNPCAPRIVVCRDRQRCRYVVLLLGGSGNGFYESKKTKDVEFIVARRHRS